MTRRSRRLHKADSPALGHIYVTSNGTISGSSKSS